MQPPPSPVTTGPPLTWEQLPTALPLVAVGGAAGAAVRWAAVDLAGDAGAVGAVLAVNVAGAFLLGILIGLGSPRRRRRIAATWFLVLGTGFAASLTSLAAFALQVAEALDTGDLGLVAVVGPATPLAAVVAGGIGYRLGRWR